MRILSLIALFLPLAVFGAEKKLSKNLSFEDLLVDGKYQFSDEAVITVESDKVLDSLLGIRKDFKDRIKRSAQKH